uniref:Uncharacterized protein n=1 Tax=Panagrolaimus sp. JU765 TaxID=591449 RepID=A0AC34QZ76_9BILA
MKVIFETGLFFWTILVAMVRPSIWFVFWLAVYLLTTCFHMVWTILDNICFDIFDDWRYSKFSLQGAVEVLKQFSVFALGQIAPDSLKLLWELLFEVLGSSWLLEVPKIKNIAIMIRQQEAFMLSPSVGILLMFSVELLEKVGQWFILHAHAEIFPAELVFLVMFGLGVVFFVVKSSQNFVTKVHPILPQYNGPEALLAGNDDD